MEAATVRAGGAPPRRRRSYGSAERRLAAWMVSPSIILILVVAAYPIGYAIWLSLNEYSIRTPGLKRFVGFDNYSNALGSSEFWTSFTFTLLFTLLSVVLETILGLAMALAMHSAFKGRGLLRTVVLVPWAILTVVTAITWQTMFQAPFGFVNSILGTFHLPGADTVWLGSKSAILAVIVFADVWKTAPFMALLLLAGLQVIPNEIYEAAKVDGATTWQRFARITMPLLRPALLVALIFRTLDALRIFDLPFVLVRGAHGTSTLSIISYEELQQNRLIGLGSALSVLTFIIVMSVAFLYIRFIGGNLRFDEESA